MDIAVLIPSYEPERKLVGFVDALIARGFDRIVVVDDGSGESYRAIFDELRQRKSCTVLVHEVNRGKGVALKTGFDHLLNCDGNIGGVLTADADGQHSVEDCARLSEGFLAGGGACAYLGIRDFSFGRIPFRSWIGNRWSSLTFALVLGKWISDTQTGLRLFPMSLIPMLLAVKGERYEYEMGVLMNLAREGAALKTLPISTIYEDGNACSHFSPLKDTIRINRLVLGEFFRFAGVSIASFAIDQGLAWLFAAMLETMRASGGAVIWFSGFAARIISSVFNFTLNRRFVFKADGGVMSSALKYALLCLFVIVLSNIAVTLLVHLGVPRNIAKFVCDVCLYFVGYRIQAKRVFQRSCRVI